MDIQRIGPGNRWDEIFQEKYRLEYRYTVSLKICTFSEPEYIREKHFGTKSWYLNKENI